MKDMKDIQLVQITTTNTSNTGEVGGGGEKLESAETNGKHDQTQAFAIGMSTAANAAIRDKFGEQPNPVHFVTGLEIARLLIEANVSLETARGAIAHVVQKFKGSRPPTTLGYFHEAILRAHANGAQRQLNAANPTAPAPRGGPPEMVGTTAHLANVTGTGDVVRTEKRLSAEYDIARQAAASDWGKDPVNAAAYLEIVAAANQTWAGFLERESGRRFRDQAVIAACAERSGFPDFETWRAEREHAPPDAPRDPPAS